jgi:quaternary ammonium compound-resistance protein SugE
VLGATPDPIDRAPVLAHLCVVKRQTLAPEANCARQGDGPTPAPSTRRLAQCYPGPMAWIFILFADLFEIAWPFVLKWSAPLSRWAPLFVVIICAIPANFLLAEAVKRLPAATVYATFVGIGTAGTAIVGMAFFGESTNLGRVCSLLLIAAGLVGLRVFSAAE